MRPIKGKKLLSLCLALVLVLALLPGEVLAARSIGGGSCGVGISWSLEEDGNLYFHGSGAMDNYSETNLPEWCNENNRRIIKNVSFADDVTSIGSYAFKGCENLEYVQLPSRLTSIGSHAFDGCTTLDRFGIRGQSSSEPVNLPSTLTSIGSYAFKDCVALNQMQIPTDVTYIANGLFSGCTSLTSVTFNGAVMIGSEAFRGCSALQGLNIPDAVTFIGSRAFQDCTNLAIITIPAGVKAISDYTFAGCNRLSVVVFPAGLYTIGNYAFSGTGLSELSIPEGVTLGAYAFSDCMGLNKVTISEGVTTIPESCFSRCTGLTKLYLPASLKTVEVNAFKDCGTIAVYYAGAREDWSKISIASGNTALSGIHAEDDPELPKVPVMVSATAAPGKITVVWQAADGAQQYQVKRTGGGQTKYTITTGLSYEDTTATGGVSYTYTVRAYYPVVSEFASKGVTAKAIAVIPLALKAVAPDKTAAAVGETITWTATAQGNTGTIQYCFWVKKDGNENGVKSGWSTEKTFSYAPTAAGTYTVLVSVRYKENTTERPELTGGSVTVSATAPAALSVTGVKANKTTAGIGETITWTATATGGSGTLQYYFNLYKDGTKIKSQAYGTAKTFSYTPTEAGSYKVRVYVKDSAGTKVNKLSTAVTVTSAIAPAISSIKADKTSAAAGEKITWTAKASGGTGTLQYFFFLYKDGVKIKSRSYSTSNTFSYTPTEAGSYKVKVYVKDSAEAKSYKTSAAVTVTTGPLAIVSVKAEKTSASVGEKITWTATASGGSGTLQYYFNLYKDGTKIKSRSYSTSNTFSYTPTEAGTYRVKVYVKDAEGTKVYKYSAKITVS